MTKKTNENKNLKLLMAKNEEFTKCLKFIFLRLDGELETLILADLKQLQLDDIPNLEIAIKEHFI